MFGALVILGVYWVILGYIRVYWGILGYIGGILGGIFGYSGLYWGYIGIMENKFESYYIGFFLEGLVGLGFVQGIFGF